MRLMDEVNDPVDGRGGTWGARFVADWLARDRVVGEAGREDAGLLPDLDGVPLNLAFLGAGQLAAHNSSGSNSEGEIQASDHGLGPPPHGPLPSQRAVPRRREGLNTRDPTLPHEPFTYNPEKRFGMICH